jgi:hypothetical protein
VKIATEILFWLSFSFRILTAVLHFVLVLLLELAFRLLPVVQFATMNSASLDVNLKRSLTDFRRGWSVLLCFFRDLRWNNASSRVPRIGDQISRFHSFSSISKTFPSNEVLCRSDHLGR